MSKYYDLINQHRGLHMKQVIEICKKELPTEWRRHPYRHPELQNGVALLHSDEGLNAYISAYGEMHMIKCRAALQNFPYESMQGTIEIVDWGCGQGIGSLCTIEAIEQHGKLEWLKKITLVEPSPQAQKRAILNVTKATNGAVKVSPINTYLPSNKKHDEIEGVDYTYINVIHVFSNILDVTDIDLQRVAKMIVVSGRKHYILCIGPMNSHVYRIDQFCSIFGEQDYFSNINDRSYGCTSDTYYTYTCKTKCFVHNGNPLNAMQLVEPSQTSIYNEYDPRLAVLNGVISQELSNLFVVLSRLLNEEDIILLQPNINGDKPDIVIVRPHKGILIIHLFEENINDYHFFSSEEQKETKNIIQKGELSPIESPIAIIDTYQKNLIRLHMDLISKMLKNDKGWGIVKKMVFFSKNTSKEALAFFKEVDKYTHVYGKELLENDELQNKLFTSMYFDRDSPEFDDFTKKQFISIITPQWHSYKEGKQIVLTTSQLNLSKSYADKKQKISGAAGAGKTQVLAIRAVNAQVRSGGNVLVLTYTKSLVNYMHSRIDEVRADFSWDKITINYYHQFFRAQANRCRLCINPNSYEKEDLFENHSDILPKYEAIFIDEVQSYETAWLQILNKFFLVEHGEFVVFGDPKQNIYNRPLDTNGDIRLGFIAGEWNKQLKEGKRFANTQLAKLAEDFQIFFFSHLKMDVFENTNLVDNSLFTNIMYHMERKLNSAEHCCKIVHKIVTKYGLNQNEVVIISQNNNFLCDIDHCYRKITGLPTTTTFICQEEKKEVELRYRENNEIYKLEKDKNAIEHNKKKQFSMNTEGLKLSTIHSFQGWESSSVILFIEPDKHNTPELIYTAITRAKENLFIINLGNEKYHSFFSENIKG